MRVNPEALGTHLTRGGLSPVYLVSGDEPLQRLEAADAIRAAARAAGHSERNVLEAAAGFDWQRLAEESRSLSLFADRRLIELRLASAKLGRDGGAALAAYCQEPPEDTLLLITMPRLDKRQQASTWFRAVDGVGVCIPVWPIDAAHLPGWVEHRLRAAGLQPAPGVAALIAQRVEGNLLAAAQEVDKLALLFDAGPLDGDQVLTALSDASRYDPFVLTAAAMHGDAARAVRVLAGLRSEGLMPLQVLWALARELRLLDGLLAAQRHGKSLDRAMQSAGVFAKRKPAVRDAVGRLRPRQTAALLALCQQADAASKGMDGADPWQLMERIVLGIAGVRLACISPRPS